MTRPKHIPIVDLMLELPAGEAGMGMAQAKKLMKDDSSKEFSHHPAQYLFKDSPERMQKEFDPEAIVAMMDQYGVQCAMIGVHPRYPDQALELFERFPGRFIGEVGVENLPPAYDTGWKSIKGASDRQFFELKPHLEPKAPEKLPFLRENPLETH